MQSSIEFDYTTPDVRAHYWDAVRELRSRGPLTWVSSLGGYWAATGYEVVLRVAQDWETFASTDGVNIARPGFDALPHIVPVETDPPRQREYRRQVNPYLTAKSLAHLEEPIRAIADELIDPLIGQGSCDISTEFARKFPGTVFFRLMVHCSDEDFRSVEPAARTISFESNKPERFTAAGNTMRAWARRVLDERPADDTRDDIVSAVKHVNDGERLFTPDEHASGLQILASGGIGTSASAIGVIMKVLGQDRELQESVRSDPSLIPNLIEECLRLEPPLPLDFRKASRDVEVEGRQIRQGEWVAMLFGAANRDPEVFEHPDEVRLDRPHYRHLSFGAGVHRCIGSNLARLQIKVAVEQLVSRLSPFRVSPGAEVEYLSLQARGPSSVPIDLLAPA